MYYDVGQRAITTNASANTETVRVQFISGSQKPTVNLTGVFANAVGSSAGGGVFTGSTFGTAGSVGSGTAVTPNKKNPNNAASGTVVNNNSGGALTGGSGTRSVRITVGFAQTGGQGGWMALTPDAAIAVLANGGTNGYLEFADLANGTSQTFNYELEWYEQ